jgi:predicted MFS family arabinose efflux permease
LKSYFSPLIASFSGIQERIWLLAAVNFINRCGAMVICFLTLYITEKLHFSLVDAGIAMSFYGIGAIFGQYFGGYFTDRLGYQKVQLATLLLNGIALFVLMQVKDFYTLCSALFILNVVSEAFRPANAIAIRMNSTDEMRTRSYSLLRVSFNLAITFALTVGGWLITKDWKWIFWADGLTCFASAAVLYFFVPEVHAPNQVTKAAQKAAAKKSISPYKDAYFMLFVFATFLGALVFMQLVWTIPPFFKQVYKWDEFTIGCICAINGAVVMLIEMPMVQKIEATKPTLSAIQIGVILYAICYLAFILPIHWMWFAAIFYMVVISFGEIFVMPFSTTWVTRRAPEAVQGQYMSMYGIAYSIANIVAPLMGTQIISRWGYSSLWMLISGIGLLSFFCFWLLGKEQIINTEDALN